MSTPDRTNEPWIRRVEPGEHTAFTGERFVPGVTGEIETEHVARYVFAAQFCAGKAVLDIASGEGYGSAMLAQVGNRVVGVDIDEASVAHARKSYRRDNLSFEVGSCEKIPCPKHSFDVVVSFETIEHIEDHARFLREVRRVLRPGGVFVCSTPDKSVYLAGQEKNPFHKKELTAAEFADLLGGRFEHTAFFGQRLVAGSVIAKGGSARTELVRTRDGRGFERSAMDERAVYAVAVCSDDRLPRVHAQVFSDERYSIGRVTNLTATCARLETEIGALGARLTAAKTEHERAAAEFARTLAARPTEEDLRRLTAERDRAQAAGQQAAKEVERLAEQRDRAQAARDQATKEVARLSEDRGRLMAERAAAENERDAAIRDAASAQVDYQRTAADLDRTREALLEAREKAAAAQASRAAMATEQETLRRATAEAMTARDRALEAQKQAEIHAARMEERALRPTGLLTAAGRAASVKTLGLGVRVGRALRLPGTERLVVARRAALFRNAHLFSPGEYLRLNPDVATAGLDPAWHYAARGQAEMRRPSAGFDPAWYLDANPDVAAAGAHPFEHYITRGVLEGRTGVPAPGRPDPAAPTVGPASRPLTAIRVGDDRATVTAPSGVPEIAVDPDQLARTKVLAFYLPQYHPIPENDQWWGRGFTEWTNVSRARPMFPGHRQPILPGELGFYDLRLPEVRRHQAELAQAAGIHGFCYYHYWFNGRRVLERPLDEVVRLGEPDFPFCVCWANENWTRRWDGLEQEILLRQQHTLASDRRFILDLIPYLEDDRYIRVDGRPVVLVYRADLMVDAQDTAAVWRDECLRAGLGEIHLCAVQFRTGDPRPLGFDAAVEFPPHHFPANEITSRIEGLDPAFGGSVFDYAAGARELIARPRKADYRLYRGVMPSWDNTARRMEQAIIHHGATPELYEACLRSAINMRQPDDGLRDNLVFINAWNEWAEGTVLEPRRDLGDAYLSATARVLTGSPLAIERTPDADAAPPAPAPAPPARPAAPGQPIDERIKRVVRSSPRLNSFVNRHPELKSRAAALLRRLPDQATPEPDASGPHAPAANGSSNGPASHKLRWRGKAINAGGPRLLVVSHDAARAGAQLILLENLRHWAARGVDCRVLLLGSGVLEPDFARVFPTACVDDLPPAARARGPDAALDALRAAGWYPDAAFCNTVAAVEAASAAARRDIPVVSAVYELPTSIDDGLGGRRTIERIVEHAARVMTASAFVSDALAKAYDLDRSRLEPIHTGVLARPLPDRDKVRAAIRAELGVPCDAFLVLGCGSIHHRKGTDLFVHAAAEARRAAPDRPIVFAWVGEDQSGPTFQNWCRHDAERLGVADVVRFVGGRDDPAPWFAGADAFALTSREDPYPMVCLEALAAGLGVVAFGDAGGAPEALLHTEGDRGLVVPYLDTGAMGRALADLATDPDRLAELRSRAGRFAEHGLRWDRYMDDIDALLASCSPRFAGPAPAEPPAAAPAGAAP